MYVHLRAWEVNASLGAGQKYANICTIILQDD